VSATDWEPGDPLMPNNGCGAYVMPRLTPDEVAEAIAEDDIPPPWFRPGNSLQNFRWRGDEPCWMCGEDPTA
jgi:hypothetical protein